MESNRKTFKVDTWELALQITPAQTQILHPSILALGSRADLHAASLLWPKGAETRPSSEGHPQLQPLDTDPSLHPPTEVQALPSAVVWNPCWQLREELLPSPACVISKLCGVCWANWAYSSQVPAAIAISWLTSWLLKQQGKVLQSLATFN